MEKTTTSALALVKRQLVGQNFRLLLAQKKISKYRLSKDTGISQQTFYTWQRGQVTPSDDSTLLVGLYLGLIQGNEAEIFNLKSKLAEINQAIERLSGGAAK